MRKLERVRFEDIDLEDTTFRSRLDFDESKIKSLAEDIKEFGQRNPIGLRETEGKSKLQVIYGWNRIFAIKRILRMDEIDTLNYGKISDLDALMHNISDNIKHEDLTTLEIAYQVNKLRKNHSVPVKRISEIYEGKTQYIYDLLNLTKMEEEIKSAVHLGEIGLTHAIEINKHPVSNQLEILRETINRGLTITQIKEKRQPKVRVKKSAKERLTEILVEAMKEGIEMPDLDYKTLQSIAIESELERMRRFLMTQVVPQSYLNKSAYPEYGGENGWTRESVVQYHVDIFKYLFDERIFTLPVLIEKINNFIFSILDIRFVNNGYRTDRDLKDPWWDTRYRHAKRGFRLDQLTNDEEFWVMREGIRYDSPCDHEYSYDEEYGEEVCIHCLATRSSIETDIPLEWRDPPYEEPPTEETYIEIGFSNQLEKSKEEEQ